MFGELRAESGARAVTRFRTQKMGGLLAYLAFHRRRAHPREVLIEAIWPGIDPPAGRLNLRVALHSLRRHLEPPGTPAGSVLRADRASVQLNPDAVETDVSEFEAISRPYRPRFLWTAPNFVWSRSVSPSAACDPPTRVTRPAF